MELSDWFSRLDWRQPAWFLLALQPFLMLVLRRLVIRRRAQRFAEAALLPWVQLQHREGSFPWRSTAHVLAWLLAAAAAAGPRLAQLEPGQSLRAGVDWMLVVDVSRSMQATDIVPSRLKRARIEALQLLDRVRGDRIGLIAYAGEAHLVAPPTYDFDALKGYLNLLEPELMPTSGSRPARALDLARQVLADQIEYPRAILLITDHAEDAATIAAADALRAANIRLFVLGMGSAGGSISVPQNGGTEVVDVALQQQSLAALARAGDGDYVTVADDSSDLQTIYDDGIAKLGRLRTNTDDEQIQWHELFGWLLLPALVLFALSLWAGRLLSVNRTATAGMAILALLYAPFGHSAESALAAQAYAAYEQGQFQIARDLYGRISGYEARMGEGASAYRMRAFDRAAREFNDALLTAADDSQRARALFNLGNSYFELGDYRSAVTTFADALRYRADFDAAEKNLGLAKLVADAVERRMPGNRPGPGQRNREATFSDGPGPRTLSESNQPSERVQAEPIAEGSPADLAELVARGVEFAQAAAQGNAQITSDAVGTADQAGAAAHMAQLQQQPVMLWRRLFEREEGFLAPLPEPRSLPEVAPW